ncbi:MAG: DUF3276 family protein [Alistipes sp.]|nr:DUF3276 family protein [Alistipes sp.]
MSEEFLHENADGPDSYVKSVFSRMIKAGHRTYYIDAKMTRAKDYFLSITELRRKVTSSGVVNERSKIHIYEEDFERFANGVNDVLDFVQRDMEESSSN